MTEDANFAKDLLSVGIYVASIFLCGATYFIYVAIRVGREEMKEQHDELMAELRGQKRGANDKAE